MGNITDGGVLTTLAFQQIPVLGPVILVVGIISFAYSTVLGWAYYGERCVEYFPAKGTHPLSCAVHCGSCHLPCYLSEPGMDRSGYPECTDGYSKPDRSTTAFQCDRKRDQKYINDLDARDDTPVEVIDK